ncbi:hypothetical protein KR009_011436 [Drosophila setifemur]|nr:hypothetical protein KR009_011436 [Drosophila setifemur]
MTKNKNKKNKNSNNPPDNILTPPGTPPVNGIKAPQNGTHANGNNRKPPLPFGKLYQMLTDDLRILKPCKSQIERELIGNFLMDMADRQVINARSEWYVEKKMLGSMFTSHLASLPNFREIRQQLSTHGAWNIGFLLYRTNFLINTPRGGNSYRIKSFALMEFRKDKFNAIDEMQRLRDAVPSPIVPGTTVEGERPITEEYVLDIEAEAMLLKYQKTQLLTPVKDFELNSFGCYICQVNFETIEKYEEHVEFHGDESDFMSLKKMKKFSSPKLTLSYQTCKNSHYFGFTLKTSIADLLVEKFIIVQSRQFYYVNHAHMPLECSASGEFVFFVDSHVFTILKEMPIVIGFTTCGHRYVEQHHFMRTEALPKANFNVNPYRLTSKETFKSQGLARANPSTEVVRALKHEDAQVLLAEYDKHFRNYCELGRKLTQANLSGTLRTLLQVEDIERLQHYLGLKQSKMVLHQFGQELSVKMQLGSTQMSTEDVLSPGDDVLIINERVTQGADSGVRQMLENNNQVLELALKDFDSIVQWAHKVDAQFGHLDKQPRVYFARILGVSTQRVNITCQRQLPDNTTFTLIFRPLRAVMRYQYRALQQLSLTAVGDVQRILFPAADIPRQDVENGILKLNNRCIGSNPEQMQAVQQIALCKKLPAPYIVFGPPGTGKTATICEAIYQLYVRRPETHILVLAGSNTACDELALRLLRAIAEAPESQPRPLTRIFAASCDRRIDNIDDLLLEYSNMYAVHFYPAVQAVHQYRIVVCTLSLAGKLSTGGFAKGNVFSHVFVDEAAASTEAEALMGITCTISPTTNLILSGDHKQLGPVLQSQRANEWGLALSLFERLLLRKCYQVDEDGSYNPSVQTRLVRNFRSHPEIVSLYSELYYSGKLTAQAPIGNVCRFQNWFHMPNAEFPIMFHSVFGTVMNTKSSVSLCNNKEIDAVMDYVKDLMYFGLNGEKVAQTDIGIISPYKSQYQRIQEQLNMRNWSQIDCGSVELFQGKEKQVVIVSFVRSFTPKLGFLNNERRLNVLLSRPMSLLILIGNPRTLSQNNDFRHIIELCRDRKTLVGVPYYREDNNPAKQTTQMSTPGGKVAQGVAAGKQPSSGLTQTLKPANPKKSERSSKLFYNKKALLSLNTPKSELDKLFDELPKVPRYVDHSSEAVRSVADQLKEMKMANKSKNTEAPKTVMSKLGASKNQVALKPTPCTAPRPAASLNVRHPLIPEEMPSKTWVHFKPSAPPSSPPKTRPTQFNYVPSGNLRFDNMRPHVSEEYERPPPFNNHRSNWNDFDYLSWEPEPKPSKPKSERKICVIS